MCAGVAAREYNACVFRGEIKKHGLANAPMGVLPTGATKSVILEDVVTTEGSVRQCLANMVSHKFISPNLCWTQIPILAVVDRRIEKEKLLSVSSLFTEDEIRQRLLEP
jgi:orotate phosphoribosyltransferase